MATYTNAETGDIDIDTTTVRLVEALHVATDRSTTDLFAAAAELLREQLVPSTRKPTVKATKGRKAQ